MNTLQKYETKPLDCWQRMKELRKDYFLSMWKAKERGEPLILGGYAMLSSLSAGLGDCGIFGVGPYFSRIMRDRDLAIRCHEAAEVKGLAADTCATLRVSLGSALLDFHNRSPWGDMVVPDFCIDAHACEAQAKTSLMLSEHYGIPFFAVDIPIIPESRIEIGKNYLISQMHQAIEWMEKVTKKKYDDELLLEAVQNEWRSQVCWAKISDFQKAIPAPLDLKMFNSFTTLMVSAKHKKGTADWLQMLCDEVEDRVKNQIAAFAWERCRLLHEGLPPWYNKSIMKLPQKYGATFIGGRMMFAIHGAFEVAGDGAWKVAKTPTERGIVIKNRDDALNALAELYLIYTPMISSFLLSLKVEEQVKVAQGWKADGVIFILDRSCKGGAAHHVEQRLGLQNEGIPSMVYEGSSADPRELQEIQVLDHLESFLQSLGLTPLPLI